MSTCWIALFATAFLVRLGFCLAVDRLASSESGGPFNYTDPASYRAIARSLSETGIFAEGPLRASRPPLYPAFLGVIFRVFGEMFWAWALPQAVLGALSCLWLIPLGKRLANERIGWIAAWTLAFYPHHAAYTPLALTETLFLFLFLAHAACAADLGSPRRAVLAGVFGGLAVLTRPVTLLFSLLIFLCTAIRAPKPVHRMATLALLAYLATLAPWTIRTRIVLDEWIAVTARLGQDLYEGNAPGATGGPRADVMLLPATTAGLPEAQRDRALAREALHAMRENPARALYLTTRKVIRTWNPLPNDPRHKTPLVTIALAASYGPVLILAAAALWRGAGTLALWTWTGGLVLYLSVLHGLLIGSVRFRLTAEPFLILAAAAGALELWNRLRGNAESGAKP